MHTYQGPSGSSVGPWFPVVLGVIALLIAWYKRLTGSRNVVGLRTTLLYSAVYVSLIVYGLVLLYRRP